MANVSDLRNKWELNKEGYKIKEIGGGVHDFISDIFQSPDFFGLQLLAVKSDKKNILFMILRQIKMAGQILFCT